MSTERNVPAVSKPNVDALTVTNVKTLDTTWIERCYNLSFANDYTSPKNDDNSNVENNSIWIPHPLKKEFDSFLISLNQIEMVKNNLGTRHPFLERALEDALNKNDKLKEMLVDIANQHRCDLSIFTEGEEKKQNEEKEKEKEEEEKEKEEYAGY